MSTMLPDELALTSCSQEVVPRPLEAEAERDAAQQEISFDQVFERYHAMVYTLTYRILGDREEALDVSQEVFLCVFRKLPRFRWQSSLKTWVYRIAVNAAANRCRWWNRLRRRGTVSLEQRLDGDGARSYADVLAAAGGSPEEALIAREMNVEIQRALMRLPVAQRIAVVMRDVEGLSYEEIATALQVSLGTVKSRIARGREELKHRLNGLLG